MAIVRSKVHRSDGRLVEGRGYSAEELKKAGSSLTEAVKYDIPVDPRRKTGHSENVKALKAFLEKKKSSVRPKRARRKSKS